MFVVPLTEAVTWLFGWMGNFISWLGSHVYFSLFGYNISYLSLVLSGILLTMVLSILFKGAKG